MEKAEKRRRRIIKDIDNTHWHLAPELWKELRKVNPKCPRLQNEIPEGPIIVLLFEYSRVKKILGKV